jgi:hypothetical protein
VSTTSNRTDPVEAEIEHALDPGRFVSDRGCFRFVDGFTLDRPNPMEPTPSAR